jgi:hypothetical protein
MGCAGILSPIREHPGCFFREICPIRGLSMTTPARDEPVPAIPEPASVHSLRAASLVALAAGAAGSVAFTLWAGHRNPSGVLIALFVIWVLSPFAALAVAYVVSKRRKVLVRSALAVLTLILSVGSLATYGVIALGPPRSKPAAFFLVVPAASWLLIALTITLAAIISQTQSS